jgi:DNA-directed RNA polymerase subunit RPC12/RpoP
VTNKKPGDFYGKPNNKEPGNYCGNCWNKVVIKPGFHASVWLEALNWKPIRLGYFCKKCRFNFENNDNSSDGAIN